VCGHQQLRYLFTIENGRNGNVLFPIGSVCIKQFGRQDLDDEAAIREIVARVSSVPSFSGHFRNRSPWPVRCRAPGAA